MDAEFFFKFLHAKLCLFLFDATFAGCHWHLLAYVAALFVAIVCKLSGLIAQIRGQGVINLLVVRSIPRQQLIYFSRLLPFFLFHFLELLFGVFSVVFCASVVVLEIEW